MSESNGTKYFGTTIEIGKTIWSIVIAKGVFNYIRVRKPTPWLTMGTEFDTVDDAINHYKNPNMKLALKNFENKC